MSAIAESVFLCCGLCLISAQQEPDASTGAVVPAISLATTFAQVHTVKAKGQSVYVRQVPAVSPLCVPQVSPGVKYGMDHPNSYNNGFEYSR